MSQEATATTNRNLTAIGHDKETALGRLDSMVKANALGEPKCISCTEQWRHPGQPSFHVATASYR